MEDIQTYTQVTTVAVCLLIVCQVVFLIVITVILTRLNKLVKNVKQTTDMSKEFVSSLRDQQLQQAPLWKLGIFAFKKARSLKKAK